MPTFRTKCKTCHKPFTWQNDVNPGTNRDECWSCEDGRWQTAGLVCGTCGKTEQLNFSAVAGRPMVEHKMCHSCNFWREQIARVELDREKRRVIVDGEHYIHCDDTGPGTMRGFGGAKFFIQFHDGRQVVSTNLWCQGTIPPQFRDALPDNATFVRGF